MTELVWAVILCVALSTVSSAGMASGKPDRDLPAASALPVRPELPDPLETFGGSHIHSKAQWNKERRAELKRLFQHYMYGNFPAAPKIKAVVEREDGQALGGKATLREVTIQLGPKTSRSIHLLVVIPNRRSSPALAFLGIAFCGNQAVLNDPKIRMADGWMFPGPGVVNNRATEASRGKAVDIWNIEQSIDRGYAVATFYYGDVEPDNKDSNEGIRHDYGHVGNQGFGAIAAWAWGIHRAMDYLVTVPEIDRKRIAVVGHSRNGKAALLSAAFDERIALVIPLQAGCGGTAPSRGKTGESVKQINTSFPHWFCDEFKQFNDQPEKLPFDQHCLVALVAPRPVLFSNAEEDSWANPAGQFEVLRAAEPVYKLLGVEGLGAQAPLPSGQLLSSRVGYFIRPGQHSMTRQDWQAFLDFADRNLGK